VYENIATTLGHFGTTLANVVTQTIYVTDIEQGIATRALRRETFGGKTSRRRPWSRSPSSQCLVHAWR